MSASTHSSSHPSSLVASWLNPVPWQLFGTFETPWRASPETLSSKFTGLIRSLEESMRTRICTVSTIENKSKHGERVPNHIHAALASLRPIPQLLVEETWLQGVGRMHSMTNSNLAEVVPFKSPMLEYVLKQISDQDCEWDVSNLQYFNSNVPSVPGTNHRSLQMARRWLKQVSMAAA